MGEAAMAYPYLDIATTPSVKAAQVANNSRFMWETLTRHRPSDRFTENETAFIAARDSFYMATVSETGWPYVQHRGGPPGFLKVLDERTLGFADFRGNRQYISVGNLGANDRVALFLMDYPNRARLKIYAHAEIRDLAGDPALAERLSLPGYKARPERAIVLHLEAFDWNCSQHITRRYTESDLESVMQAVQERIAALQSENEVLHARLRDSANAEETA
jgi:predicted pyridoxine 5'-phosphate oxidase superfamily flavin-nucleotide-binding protein